MDKTNEKSVQTINLSTTTAHLTRTILIAMGSACEAAEEVRITKR
ncbi:MAG: hypothetical protein ACLTK0_02075 [Anaerovoracaceae bacterium]